MDEASYHSHAALSHSQIEDFLVSPALYYARHVERSMPPHEDTEATAIGSATHAIALEGRAAYDSKVCIWRGGLTKEGKPTTSRNSTAYKQFAEDNAGRIELDEDSERCVASMLDALRAHEDAALFLWGTPGESEKSLFWRDVEDVEARCRLDRVIPEHDIIVDIKTARDVTDKGRAKCIAERGYHRKAEWYRRAYVANYGRPLREFVFVWVCTAPTATAYDRVVVSSIGPVAESLASAQIDNAVRDILRRRESNDWRPPRCIGVQLDELPGWAVDRDLLQEIQP
jgi:hypothetical protein